MFQFRSGRAVTSIARIQKVSRQFVYKLIGRHRVEGEGAFRARKSGRPKRVINRQFASKVVSVREATDYGSEKLHYVLRKDGFSVSRRQIQRILDEAGLTKPCVKRRGQRKYVRYQWPISNYMWHTDWTEFKKRQYLAFIDDRSRRIMGAGVFDHATAESTLFLFYHSVLQNEVCPVIVLSDKGTQFFANTPTKSGERALSKIEQELNSLGIELWTSRRNHPQTNGKMEKLSLIHI